MAQFKTIRNQIGNETCKVVDSNKPPNRWVHSWPNDDLPVVLARKDRDLFGNAFKKNPFQDSDPLCLVMDAQGSLRSS